MRKITTVIFAAFICAVAFGELLRDAAGPIPEMPQKFRSAFNEVVERAKEATLVKYPDADTVIVENREHSKYEVDGSEITWEESWEKCLTEKGRRGLSSISTWMSLRYGDAAILCVEIVGKDGTLRTVDFKKTLKEASDNSSMESNIYDPLDMNLACAVPDLEIGEMRHTIIAHRILKPRMADSWIGISLMESFEPIMKAVYSVDSPDALPPKVVRVRNQVKDTLRRLDDVKADGRTLMCWVAEKVPQAFPEPAMPSFSRVSQQVALSTSGDWSEISKWYWDVCLPHLEKTNPAMTNKVNELVAGLTSDDEKIRALFRFVSQEIRYMGLTLEDTSPGYAPHDVNITFDNRYGVCRDKAGLLVEMLRIAGYKAFPTLINVGTKIDHKVPMPYFNHAIVAVDLTDGERTDLAAEESPAGFSGYTLMDPTNEATKELFPAYLMNRSFLVCRPEGETLRVSPVEEASCNAVVVKSHGELDDYGALRLECGLSFTGYIDNIYRNTLLRKSADERKRMFEKMVRQVISGGEIESIEISPMDLRDTDQPFAVKMQLYFPNVVLQGETVSRLEVPFVGKRFGIARKILLGDTSLENRRFPLVESVTAENVDEIEIRLPRSMRKVSSLPEDFKCGKGFRFERTFSVEDGVLKCRRKESLSELEFSPQEYVALREDLKAQETADRPMPLLAAKDREADADIRILKLETFVNLESVYDWVSTNHVVTKVLTYDGKKSSAEKRYYYNPSFSTTEIVSASVSNLNGQVHLVTPKEINLMDDNWVLAAPRYPAGKLLVLTLPGVEIGSVIDIVIAKRVKNSPEPFFMTSVFASDSPIDRKCFAVRAPRGLDLRVTPLNGMCAMNEKADGDAVLRTWEMENLKMYAKEQAVAEVEYWLPTVMVSAGDSVQVAKAVDFSLRQTLAKDNPLAHEKSLALTEGKTGIERVKMIRDYLAQRIRIVGPDLFGLKLEDTFTMPDKVLAEGYGSYADYICTLKFMLDAAGVDSRVLLVTGIKSEKRVRIWQNAKCPFMYSTLLLELMDGEGRPLGKYLGAENQYALIGETHLRHEYIDVATGETGRIAPLDDFESEEHKVFTIRPNGTADLDVICKYTHDRIGEFRKKYAEMTPEEHIRHYRALLGGISENASATSELKADIKSDPAELRYSAVIPGFAEVSNGMITFRVPDFAGALYNLDGDRRETPLRVGERAKKLHEVEVVFPERYTEIEHLPAGYQFGEPSGVEMKVEHFMRENQLVVRMTRIQPRVSETVLQPEYFPLLREWNRKATSATERTISVRKQ